MKTFYRWAVVLAAFWVGVWALVVFGQQCWHWLRTAEWRPYPVRTITGEWAATFSWENSRGLEVVALWLGDLSLPLVALGVVLLSLYWLMISAE